MKALRVCDEPARRRILRKLHIRWWHATAAQMKRLLQQAGQPVEVVDLIDGIVDTCAVCRTWMTPRPDSQASANVTQIFNHQVELDLMYYKKKVILHLVDRCTRWHAGKEVDGKEMATLIAGIDEVWVGIHGPMKELIVDGETALKGGDTQLYMKRKGIHLIIRGPGQHARFIERRGALLRDVLHKIDSQLVEEGLTDVPFGMRLREAIFVGNALLSVNDTTPYNALYGRVPQMLPDINGATDASTGGARSGEPGSIRHAHRLREISVQRMVEHTAQERVKRALNTRTLPAAQTIFEKGDMVDYHRPPSQKDLPGWTGPAKITDMTQVSRGIIKVDHDGRELVCSPKDLRQHMAYLCFLAAPGAWTHHEKAMQVIRRTVEQISMGHLVTVGHHMARSPSGRSASGPRWCKTPATKQYAECWMALQHVATVSLALSNVVAARCGRGVPSLPPVRGYEDSLLLTWQGNVDNTKEHRFAPTEQFNFRLSFGRNWEQTRWVQFLLTNEAEAQAIESLPSTPEGNERNDTARETRTGEPELTPRNVDGGLSPIPEGTDEDASSVGSLVVYNTADKELVKAGRTAAHYLSTEVGLEPIQEFEPDEADRPDAHVYAELSEPVNVPDVYLHVRAANLRADLDVNAYLDYSPSDAVELGIPPKMYASVSAEIDKLILEGPQEPYDHELVVVELSRFDAGARPGERRIYLANKKAVIERDTDLLTPDELEKHREEVVAATVAELRTWHKHGCFSRRPRRTARNIVDCKWVIKWKNELLPDKSTRRIIRARLTIRGFKDRDAAGLERYAGTSQRYSQRLLVSEAVCRQWPLISTDISKAFLQGVTYEELARLTGEPLREVNFYLPSYSLQALRQIPGFENFDPAAEVLHCDKPGTGSVDAPRAFHLKLAQVTRNECNLVPTKTDEELLVLHTESGGARSGAANKELVAILAIHVDDLKIAGDPKVILKITKAIERTFGELILQWHNFTNCGIRHIQDPETFECSMDQIEYVNALKQIHHPDVHGGSRSGETIVGAEAFELFRSLRGAVGYALITRADASVYMVALQRKQPDNTTVADVKALNAVVAYMQKFPEKVHYPRLGPKSHFRLYSDSAFKKELDCGHAIKGTLVMRVSGTETLATGVRSEKVAQGC